MKKFLKILGLAGSITAAGLIATHRGGGPATPPVDHTAEWTQACSDIFQQLLERQIHADESNTCVQKARAGAQDGDLRNWVRDTDEYRALQAQKAQPPSPPAPTLQALHGDGRIFRTADGQPWRYMGFSSFALEHRLAQGQDISDTLTAYRGYTVARVWPYVPAKDWGASAWDDLGTPQAAVDLAARLAKDGFYVEFTLLTDDDPARIPQAQQLVATLVAARPPNVLLEIGNEPESHKAINVDALIPAVSASGFPWTTGNYEDASKMRGTYGVDHTGRDPEWVRRAHDLFEFFTGGGPNAPSDPPHHFPIVADEPPKLQDVGASATDWRAYFGAASLLGAGATFHSETGKFGLPPTPDEAVLAKEALAGMTAFPADVPLGAYTRIDENGRTLRTYIVGNDMVRQRPTTKDAPEPGWTPIDADGILWRK